jgi:hypothetical protein
MFLVRIRCDCAAISAVRRLQSGSPSRLIDARSPHDERKRRAGQPYQQLDAGDRDISGAPCAFIVRELDSAVPPIGGRSVMNRPSRTVVAVSDDALRSELLDALLAAESDYDIIVVESIPRAYSRIRELRPDLVVVFMDIDDANACQLLSMLEVDRAFGSIRVMTSATEPEGSSRARAARCRGTSCGCPTAQPLC